MNSPFPGRSEPHDSQRTVPSNQPVPAPDLCSASSPVVLNEAGLPLDFGHYRLLARLGSGGMGTVYLAHDRHLARDVALKVLPDGADEQWREMFLREAQAAAALDHPNLCPVYEVGEEGGRPYLAMKYIKGQTLSEAYKPPIPPRQGAAVVRDLARAMGAAHASGVVHRDLKPANVMVDGLGEPVVVDFGVAVRLAPGDSRLTQEPVARGTPAYMAPEQASDPAGVGPATDVWALGVILFELVAGRRPFEGQSPLEILVRSASDDPPSPRAINPLVDPALEAIILTCLEKNPADRYATGTALATALGGYLAPRRPAPRKRLLVAGLVVAALVLALTGTAIYLSTKRGEPVAKIDPATPVATDPGKDKGGLPPVPPVVIPDPGKNLPPLIALEPGEGNAFRTGEWEYLIDATYAGATKWLDSHRGKHSVMWLDAYMVGDKPRFAALAALDDRQKDWIAMLDIAPPPGFPALLDKVIDITSYSPVAVSGYTQGSSKRMVLLAHPIKRTFQISAGSATPYLSGYLTGASRNGVVRQVRPLTQLRADTHIEWAFHSDSNKDRGRPLGNATEQGARQFLIDSRKENLRVGSIAACVHNGELVFGAAAYADKDATDWDAEIGLSAKESEEKAKDMATKGFTPTSLTGYATKGGTRFCAVWVKYAKKDSPKSTVTLEPGEGRVISVNGYEYLVDATRPGARKWLDAHKTAGHSALWLDAYQVGDAPKFAAVVAPAAGAEWDFRLDVLTSELGNSGTRGRVLPPKKSFVVSLSTYSDDKVLYSAFLSHSGDTQRWMGPHSSALLDYNIREATKQKGTTRHLRPFTEPGHGLLGWAWLADERDGAAGANRLQGSLEEVKTFLDENKKDGKRPGSVAGCENKGALVFSATAFADPGASESAFRLGLTAAALEKEATEMARAGFVPVSLTGYREGADTRFCAVWVKYAPNKEPKTPVTLDPKDGTIIAVAGYEYLIDASKDGARKWLDAQKAAKHSVMWLDAYSTRTGPRFAALAALDDRQTDWKEHLDVYHGGVGYDPKTLLDTKQYALVALGGYTDLSYRDGERGRVALLWHASKKQTKLRVASNLPPGREAIELRDGGVVIHQLRPYPDSGTVRWAWHHDLAPTGEPSDHAMGSEKEVRAVLDKYQKAGFRPGSVAGCEQLGKNQSEVVFGATVYEDKNVLDSKYQLNLTASELAEKALALGKDGFVPVSLTGYATKDAPRFCAVWVKYAPKK